MRIYSTYFSDNLFDGFSILPIPTPISLVVYLLNTLLDISCNLFWFLLANTSTPWVEYFNYNIYNSIRGFIEGNFNFWYEQGHMVMCSLFPDKIPPLPGRKPLSFPMLVVFLVHCSIIYIIADNVRVLFLRTFKFFSFLILPYFPFFTIKYLFYFDRQAQIIWIPLLILLNTPVKDKKLFCDDIVVFYAIRRNAMILLFMHILNHILSILVFYALSNFIGRRVYGL